MPLLRCAVTVEYLWHRVPGGSARAAGEILRRLAADDSLDLIGISARHRSAGARSPLENTVAASLPRPLLYEAWHRLGHPTVESLVGEVDVVWGSALAVPASKAPTVVTVHDIEFLEHPEWLSRRGRSFYPQLWRAVTRRADRIVVPTNIVAEQVIERGVPATQVAVIPLGVETALATQEAVAHARVRFELPETFVLWVGTVEPRKNLAGLVSAMTQLDVPLVVVGPDGWQVNDVDLLAPLGGRVQRLGVVSSADLQALYSAASVFVLPSHAEGFGLPVIEAMAQGTPVVTSRGTATEEVAGGAAHLVDPADPDHIAAGIRQVLEDEAEANRLCAAGLARAAQLTWTETASQYRALFDELAGRTA